MKKTKPKPTRNCLISRGGGKGKKKAKQAVPRSLLWVTDAQTDLMKRCLVP